MNSKGEQALVGTFVIVAAAVLVATVFLISGAFGRSTKTFHSYFPFAGGLEPGATVRYSGGPKAGRVDKLRIDPQNPARIEIVFSVQSDLPVKVDSKAKIMSMSPLGDNHLEIFPGSPDKPVAQNGAELPSETYVDFNALTKHGRNRSGFFCQSARKPKQRVSRSRERVIALKRLAISKSPNRSATIRFSAR